MKEHNKPVTISDIAARVGVSTATISRYLNGKYQYMSEDTRQKIATAIETLGYRPNNIARSLKLKETKTIGVSLAAIESPFSASVVKGIFDECLVRGYSAIIVNSNNRLEIEEDNVRSLIAQRVDGLIVNTTDCDNPFLKALSETSFPIVLLDRFVKNYSFDITYIECKKTVRQALMHLFNAGFQKIACFIPPYQQISPRYLRYEAFIEVLTEYGVKDPDQYVYVVNTDDLFTVREAVLEFMKQTEHENGPSAIFACTGVMLFTTCNAVISLNIKMPAQLGILGMDDWGWSDTMDWGDMVGPGITTMSAATIELGKTAVELLMNRIKEPSRLQQVVPFQSRLRIRGSTNLNP